MDLPLDTHTQPHTPPSPSIVAPSYTQRERERNRGESPAEGEVIAAVESSSHRALPPRSRQTACIVAAVGGSPYRRLSRRCQRSPRRRGDRTRRMPSASLLRIFCSVFCMLIPFCWFSALVKVQTFL
ncbi:uncharacterized protein DS421_17g587490 [Arachis hypogaea]|nr:uncharacterized protein DS421_17g587490 [Arachis hypogaea]QHN92847.1 uncharacterized protein DS421_17g587490 [Arachis hypogaea]